MPGAGISAAAAAAARTLLIACPSSANDRLKGRRWGPCYKLAVLGDGLSPRIKKLLREWRLYLKHATWGHSAW